MEFERRFCANRCYGERIPRPKTVRKHCIPDESLEELVKLFDSGASYSELAKKYFCSDQCIRNTIARYRKKQHKSCFY